MNSRPFFSLCIGAISAPYLLQSEQTLYSYFAFAFCCFLLVRHFRIFIFGFSVALVLWASRLYGLEAVPAEVFDSLRAWKFEIVEVSKYGSLVELESAKLGPGNFAYSSYKELPELPIKAELKSLSSREFEGLVGQELARRLKGVIGRLRPAESPDFYRNYEDEASFLNAVIYGDSASITQNQWRLWSYWGLSHLLVVSAFHLLFVYALSFWLLRRLPFPLARAALWARLLALSTLVFYIFYLELGVSSIRAGSMIAFSLGLSLFLPQFQRYRKSELLSALAFLFILVEPASVFSLGYVFSFGISWFISICFESGANRLKFVSAIAVLSSVFFAGLQNLLLSLWTILINPLMCSLFSFVLYPISWFGVIFPAFAQSAEEVWSFVENQLNNGLILLSKIQLNWVLPSLSVFALVVAGFVWMQNKLKLSDRLKLVCCLLLFSTIQFPDWGSQIRYEQIDVGQGDASLIRIGSKNVLVDGGKYESLSRSLVARGVTKIHLWILTHFDEDHSGAFEKLAHFLEVDEVWVPFLDNSSVSKLLKAFPVREEPLEGGLSKCFSSHCLDAASFSGRSASKVANRHSLFVGIRPNEAEHYSIVLLGDMHEPQERRLVGWLRKRAFRRSELLKIAHHGSTTSTSEELISYLRPRIAVIGVGRGNRYSFPRSNVLDRLERWGAIIKRTDTLGSSEIYFDF